MFSDVTINCENKMSIFFAFAAISNLVNYLFCPSLCDGFIKPYDEHFYPIRVCDQFLVECDPQCVQLIPTVVK